MKKSGAEESRDRWNDDAFIVSNQTLVQNHLHHLQTPPLGRAEHPALGAQAYDVIFWAADILNC